MSREKLFSVLLLFGSVFCLFSNETALSRMAYREAELYLGEGRTLLALNTLDKALEYNPANSDALFLQARLDYTDKGMNLHEIVSHLELAWEYGNFVYSDVNRFLAYYMSRMFEAHLYQKAEDLYRILPASLKNSQEIMYLAQKGRLYRGFSDKSIEEFFKSDQKKAMVLYPFDGRFRLMDLMTRPLAASDILFFKDKRILMDKQLLRLSLLKTPFSRNRSLLMSVWSEYYNDSLTDSVKNILGHESWSLYPEDLNDLLTATHLLVLLGESDKALVLADHFRDQSGELSYDSDSDGFDDTWYILEGGYISSLKRDLNRDGNPEMEVLWNSGKIISVLLKDFTRTKKYSYDRYPYVTEISLSSSDDRFLYKIKPGVFSFEWQALTDNRAGHILFLETLPFSHIDESTFRKKAYTRESVNLVSGRHEVHFYNELGQITKILKYSEKSSDKSISMEIWKAWKPVYIYLDGQGDGFFETCFFYYNGRKAGFMSDYDQNGSKEFYHGFFKNHEYKLWDFNEDGQLDEGLLIRKNTGDTRLVWGSDVKTREDFLEWNFKEAESYWP